VELLKMFPRVSEAIALVVALMMGAVVLETSRARATDWPTYAFNVARTGYNPNETTLGASNASELTQKWAFDARAYDLAHGIGSQGAVFIASPVLASHTPLSQGPTDLLLVGDTNGVFFALDAHSPGPVGTLVWSANLGLLTTTPAILHCYPGDHNGIITSAVLDRAANAGLGAAYVAYNGFVHAVSLIDGTLVPGWPRRGLPLPVSAGHDSSIKAAPNLVNGTLYVGTTGVCDHTQPYHGQLIGVDVTKPAVAAQWYVLGGTSHKPTMSGGGIWGAAGVAAYLNGTGGGILVGTGNGLPDGATEDTPFAEYLVKLSFDLSVVIAANSPPAPLADTDFGSSPMVFHPAACSRPGLVAIPRKSGALHIYDVNSIASGPIQTVQVADPNSDLLQGVASWDPVAQLLYVSTPTNGTPPMLSGVLAFGVGSDCALSLVWHRHKTPAGELLVQKNNITSPVVANGVVYVGIRNSAAPKVYALSAATGKVLWSSGPEIENGVYAEPIVVNGMLFVTDWNGVVHAYGL
jgi:outer membrane protein assembly factor BamB